MTQPAETSSPSVETVAETAPQAVLPSILSPSPLEVLRSLLTLLVIAFFILTFIVQPFRIPSESMEHTLLVGDFLLVNKAVYGPPGHFGWLLPYRAIHPGSIVVFHFPLDPPVYVIKRVIGVPGDRIHLVNGVVYRNGRPMNEPYVTREPAYPDEFRDNFPAGPYTSPSIDTHWFEQMRSFESGGDIVVPANSYFVMGDNRNYSRDSRYWGFVPRANIEGGPVIIYFSLRRRSTTDVSELPPRAPLPSADGKLKDEGPPDRILDRIVDFARWSRILRVVR